MKAYGYNVTRNGRTHRFACCDLRNGCCCRSKDKTKYRVFKKRARAQGKAESTLGNDE